MEREGRGRRGGEMRKGIVIGGMIIGLLMGCNNGAIEELEKKNKFLGSVVNLGNEFLNVFTSFGEMISGETLGFKAESKKSDVAKYFKKVKETVEGAKSKLNTMVENMKSKNNPNASKTEGAVTDLNKKLDKIIEGASDAMKGADGEGAIGNVVAGTGDSAGAAGTGVEDLVKGIGKIVEVVLKDEGSDQAGTDTSPVKDYGSAVGRKRAASGAGADGDAGKLFIQADAGTKDVAAKAAKDATKAVGSVSGADILKSISKGIDGIAAKLAKSTNGNVGTAVPKDAEIAGGIALRAMSKNGKFSNGNNATVSAEGGGYC